MNPRFENVLRNNEWFPNEGNTHKWRKGFRVPCDDGFKILAVEFTAASYDKDAYPMRARFDVADQPTVYVPYGKRIVAKGKDRIICHLEDFGEMAVMTFQVYGAKIASFHKRAKLILETANKF